MNQPVVAFVIGLLVVGGVATGVMLIASRKGDATSSRLAFWVVLGAIVIFVGMFATVFLSGYYGDIGD